MIRQLYRVRRFNDAGTLMETRFYQTIHGARSRAMRWRGAGYDVDVFKAAQPKWSRLCFAGEERRCR